MNENDNIKMKETEKQREKVNAVNTGSLGNVIKNGTDEQQAELIKHFKSEVLLSELKYRLTTAEDRVDAITKITKATR